MTTWKRALSLLILTASLGMPATAFAQRRVPVVDADEAGRQPYQVTIQVSALNPAPTCLQNCSNLVSAGTTNISFDGPAVPAGKRLVIHWISARVPGGSLANSLYLQSASGANSLPIWQFHGPFFTGAQGVGMSSAAFVTIEPGDSPHVLVLTSVVGFAEFGVTLSGYLIDAV